MPTEPSSSPDAGGVALLLSAVTTVVGGAWLTAREVIAWRNRRAMQRLEADTEQAKLLVTTQADHEKLIWQRIRDLMGRVDELEGRVEQQLDENFKLAKELQLTTLDRDRLLAKVTTYEAAMLDMQTHHAEQVKALEACVKRVTELEGLAAKWSPFPPEPKP